MKRLCFAVVLCAAMMVAIGCEKAKMTAPEGEEAKGQTGENVATGGSVNVGTIAIYTADSKTVNISAEIATTDDERMKGLMGRESLAKNYGMWFVFPYDVQDAFWMKDTLVALDIIFVGSDMKIVDVIANAQPKSEELLKPRAPYRYVLEVAAGTAAANGIAIGDRAEQRVGPAQ